MFRHFCCISFLYILHIIYILLRNKRLQKACHTMLLLFYVAFPTFKLCPLKLRKHLLFIFEIYCKIIIS